MCIIVLVLCVILLECATCGACGFACMSNLCCVCNFYMRATCVVFVVVLMYATYQSLWCVCVTLGVQLVVCINLLVCAINLCV